MNEKDISSTKQGKQIIKEETRMTEKRRSTNENEREFTVTFEEKIVFTENGSEIIGEKTKANENRRESNEEETKGNNKGKETTREDNKTLVEEKTETTSPIIDNAKEMQDIFQFEEDKSKILNLDLQKQGTEAGREEFRPYEEDVVYGPEANLHEHYDNCSKNPKHEQFIPIKSFGPQQLPVNIRKRSIFKLVKTLGELTVKLTVTHVSNNRPEVFNEKSYPLSECRGQKGLISYGSGRVVLVKKFTMTDGQTCPCSTCKQTLAIKKWAEIRVATATHVVFDDEEAKHTTISFNYDSDTSQVTSITGTTAKGDVKGDVSILCCVTHDLTFAKRLADYVEDFNWLSKKVFKLYERDGTIQDVAIVVSHPHGCPKHVSLGQWTDKTEILGWDMEAVAAKFKSYFNQDCNNCDLNKSFDQHNKYDGNNQDNEDESNNDDPRNDDNSHNYDNDDLCDDDDMSNDDDSSNNDDDSSNNEDDSSNSDDDSYNNDDDSYNNGDDSYSNDDSTNYDESNEDNSTNDENDEPRNDEIDAQCNDKNEDQHNNDLDECYNDDYDYISASDESDYEECNDNSLLGFIQTYTILKYQYTAGTCKGSSGAPVFIIARDDWKIYHLHSWASAAGNYSGYSF